MSMFTKNLVALNVIKDSLGCFMQNLKTFLPALAVAAGVAFSGSQAHAEMGGSPVEPGTIYMSLLGGYLFADVPKVIGYASGPSSGVRVDRKIGVPNNWFAGAEIGYNFKNGASWLGVNRVELVFETGRGTEEKNRHDQTGSMVRVTGTNSGVIVALPNGFPQYSSRERIYYEGSIRLRNDQIAIANQRLNLYAEPFSRTLLDETFAALDSSISRKGDVSSFFGGIMLGIEPEIEIANKFAIVFGLSGGLYYVHADGEFSDNSTPDQLGDTEDALGLRARASLALKKKLSERMSVSLFGLVDYWSASPFASMPTNLTPLGIPAKLDFEQSIEAKAGVRVTFALGQNEQGSSSY